MLDKIYFENFEINYIFISLLISSALTFLVMTNFYFKIQYKIDFKPNKMQVGKNFITDKVVTTVNDTPNGIPTQARWYQFKIPVKFIGVGEQASDLIIFDKKAFVEGLFKV